MRRTVFETPRFARAVALAGREAAALRAPAVGTGHLLLGLAVEGAERGDPLLAAVTPERVRGLLPLGGHAVGVSPLSVRAAAAMTAAWRLASAGDEPGVGVHHLLAGVLTIPLCTAVDLLGRLGVDAGDLWVRASGGSHETVPALPWPREGAVDDRRPEPVGGGPTVR